VLLPEGTSYKNSAPIQFELVGLIGAVLNAAAVIVSRILNASGHIVSVCWVIAITSMAVVHI
jgi:hypothetical protein